MLEIDTLYFSYGDTPVIDDFSLRVNTGSIVAIVGKSGCGKSTLLHIIAGLQTPIKGTIRWNHMVPTHTSHHVSYMQQQDLLLPWLKVIDNVALPLHIQGAHKKTAHTKALAMLEHFSLHNVASYYPAQLSGGMRQRVALMRTCIASKELLLLDEPFSRLDYFTRYECLQWAKQVFQELASTVIFITHDIDEAIAFAERILVVSDDAMNIRTDIAIQQKATPSQLFLCKEQILHALKGNKEHPA